MYKNDISTYKQLQSFSSIEDMNDVIRHYRNQYADQLTPSAYRVLDAIARYSCKYIGVSFRSKSKIADELGVSRRTIIRACQQLEKLGVIKQYELMRHNGDKRQAASAIVIQPCVTAECHTKETPLLNSKSNNTDETEKTVATKEVDKQALIKDGLVSKLPPTLQHALAPFFDYNELYALAGVVFKAKASVDKSIRIEEHEAEYYKAIIEVMSAYKRGKVRNLPGLLSHAVKATTRAIWLRKGFDGIVFG